MDPQEESEIDMMGKRWITLLLTAFAVMMLSGCGMNKKAVTETAEGFLTAIVNNDKETAAQFASEDFMKSEAMQFMDPQHLADSFYAVLKIDKEELDEEAVKAVDDYVNELVVRAYQGYEIQDVNVRKDSATVTAKITLGYDPDASSGISEETQELIDRYQNEQYDELVNIKIEEGEKAMYKKLYNDLIPIVIGKMHEQIENGGTSEEKTVLTLSKIDKTWIVTALEENRPSAAEAVSAQEAAVAADTAAEAAAGDSTASEIAAEESTESGYAAEGSTSAEYAGTGNTAAEFADEEESRE